MHSVATADQVLDTRGSYCPAPILQARQAIDGLASGRVLTVLADDPAAEEDIQRWAKRVGHDLLEMRWEDGYLAALIRKS